eukprot:TRINITY_DN75656_c0_g1_i1.p1 TRINITY_DN75656_c0_g1~~TRINITY_DN75656_c0_g1_i1.p1  ORF type:complete len:698 (-),score=88.96 TRINITY_DN75656_c0_g1_i1:182-2104(-)
MNASVSPGDNFYEFANGNYISQLEIPADQTRWGPFGMLANESLYALRSILDRAARSGDKIGSLFASFMDEAQVEEHNLTPLQPLLSQLEQLKNKTELARLMGKSNRGFVPSVFQLRVGPDPKSDSYAVFIHQGGLGLPDRDYYSADGFAKARTAYVKHASNLLTMVGWPQPESASHGIFALEQRIANVSWTRSSLRDPIKTYHPVSLTELEASAAGFDWRGYLDEAGPFPQETKIVLGAHTAISDIAKIFADTDIDVLRNWQAFHTVRSAAIALPQRFQNESFNFSRVLSGELEQSPRWKRGVALVNKFLGDAIGQEYVKEHFSASSKLQVLELVKNLKKAFRQRLMTAGWLSNSTKEKAVEKLKMMDVQVGYPEKFRSYNDVEINKSDLFGNLERCILEDWNFDKGHLGKRVNRQEWMMTPQTVNAYYNPEFNQIVFPAAVLQSPFFDSQADSAVNYGALGAVIGHEMTHGFDDSGRQYDAKGRLADWWTDSDEHNFIKQAKKFGKQYEEFTIGMPEDAHINPSLTMGENIADMGGVTLAVDAYCYASAGNVSSSLRGGTQRKDVDPEKLRRLFFGYAQVWRSKTRADSMKRQLVTDPHSPSTARTILPVRNLDSWYAAFNISADSALFLPQEKRVVIW